MRRATHRPQREQVHRALAIVAHPASADLHAGLVRIIRQVRPQRVLTWSPQWNWQRFRSCHPDHLATGAAALAAIYPDAGNPFALPELAAQSLPAWTVREAWLLNSPAREINHHADITATFDRKAAAVRAHRSQIENPDTLPERLRDRIAANTGRRGPGRRPAPRKPSRSP